MVMGNGSGNGNGNGGPSTGRHEILGGTKAMLRRHGAAYLRQQARGRPRVLELQVTRGCDARCAWCDAWRAPGNGAELADFAPIVRRIGPLNVALVGGEPLLRADLERIAASLRLSTEVSSIAVLTNGLALEVDRARRLREAGVDKLILTLEGLGEENDRARRCPGLSERIDRLLPELADVGFRTVQLQMTVTGRSTGQLAEAVRYARERDVRVAYSVESLERLESRSTLRDERVLGRLATAIEEVIDLAERWSHVVSSPEYLRGALTFLRGEAADVSPCAAGGSFLRVTPDGWVQPCGSQPPLGHWTAYPFPPAALDCPGCWSRLRGETQADLGVSRLVELYRASGAET